MAKDSKKSSKGSNNGKKSGNTQSQNAESKN